MQKTNFAELNAISKNRPLIIFGAGHLCHKTLLKIPDSPILIVDNSPNLWGTEQGGISIKPPDRLKEYSLKPFVVICTTSFPGVIDQVCSLGYKEEADICVTPLLNGWRTIEELQNHHASLLFTSGLSSSGTSSAKGGLYHLSSRGKEFDLTHIIEGSAHGIMQKEDMIW